MNQIARRIGDILIDMGLCNHEQIEQALIHKQQATADERLGAHLLYLGFISQAQLAHALDVQERLRSSKRYQQALAQADVAQMGVQNISKLTANVKRKSTEVRRKTTGKGYPAVQPSGDAPTQKITKIIKKEKNH